MGIFSLSFGQSSKTGSWIGYISNNSIGGKWNLMNEIHYRNYNYTSDFEQLVFRTGVGYNTSKISNISAGYAFISTGEYDSFNNKSYYNEHRLFQEYSSHVRFSRFYITQRNRLEERFKLNQTTFRIRYFSQIICPINKKNLEKNAFYLMAYNELFVNFKSPRFDRDRMGGTLGFCFNNDLRLEVGIMKQVFETKNRPQFQMIFYNTMRFL